MKNRRKPWIIALITIAAVAAVAAGLWFFWLKDHLSVANASPVYVNPVSAIIGMDTGANPRYSGIVEPQETYQVRKDDSKTVSEVLVRVGDEVHAGDLLFRYDNEAIAMDLTQAEIDQESIAEQIATYQRQLKDLQDKLAKAAKDDQYAYTVQINALEIQIKRQEFESDKKAAEVENLREALTNTDVYAEVDGMIKEINNTPESYASSNGAFISILAAGDYRIKGTVSELNVAALSVGQAVTVHSRLDAEVTWSGTVTSIDQEAASNQENNGYYYYGMDSGERSSKYHFYVTLNNPEGLILGQHVYIEPSTGSTEKKEGLWLPAMYVDHDEEGSFVWAKNDQDRLEKRIVILGDYDSDGDLYEIKSGVSRVDSIAFPSEDLKPGMPTTMDAAYQGANLTDVNNGVILEGGDVYTLPEGAEEEFGGYGEEIAGEPEFYEDEIGREADNAPADGETSSYIGWEDGESAGGGEGSVQ